MIGRRRHFGRDDKCAKSYRAYFSWPWPERCRLLHLVKTTTTASTKAGTSMKIAATTATAMTTEITRAGIIRTTPTTATGIPTATAYARGGRILTAPAITRERSLSHGASITGPGAGGSPTIRIGAWP